MPRSRSRRRPIPPPRNRRATPARPVPPVEPGLRTAVERRSAPVLTWLTAQPRLLLPLVSLALLIGGLAAPPAVGLPLLLALLAIVGWLTYLSWPAVQGGGRVVRVVTLGLLVAALLSRLQG